MSEQTINKGFSKIAAHYEELEKKSSLIRYMRQRIYNHLESRLKPQAKVLEINAGTGIDAIYLANKGYKILATDIASGMLGFIKNKLEAQPHLKKNLSYRLLSNTDLNKLKPEKFDHIFSNFGGLNCSHSHELKRIFRDFHELLYEDGKITLVIMPQVCFWEWARILKGDKSAFRRLRKGGTLANIEGEKVRTYYYGIRHVKKWLSPYFKDFDVENLMFFGPTGNKIHFPEKHPFLFKILQSFDFLSSKIPFLQGMGDYYIISARKK